MTTGAKTNKLRVEDDPTVFKQFPHLDTAEGQEELRESLKSLPPAILCMVHNDRTSAVGAMLDLDPEASDFTKQWSYWQGHLDYLKTLTERIENAQN